MPQIAPAGQEETFDQKVKIALIRRGKTVDWLAGRLNRPRASVSTAINNNVFPLLRKEIAAVLGISL
jgi:predicted transcriptional regulator